MLRLVRDVDILQSLQPLPDGRGSVNAWDVGPSVVDQSPSVRAVGILSPSLTGKRSTCIVGDDLETLSNSITVLKQERLAAAITELEAIRKPTVKGELPRKTIFLGTPHLESSLYLRMRRERNYQARMWPARYPSPTSEAWDSYEGCLDPSIAAEVEADPSIAGEPTDPERFGHDELLKREMSMTRASVQLQYQLDCRLSRLNVIQYAWRSNCSWTWMARHCLKLSPGRSGPEQRIQDLVCIGMGADRFYHRPMISQGWVSAKETWRCVLSIDPSGRGKDEMAWTVLGRVFGKFLCIGVRRHHSGLQRRSIEDALDESEALERHAGGDRVQLFGDGMFAALLQPVMNKVHPCGIDEIRVTQQKERRICDQLAPLTQQHRLVISADVIRKDYQDAERNNDRGYERSLLFQMSRITMDRGSLSADDRIDSLALACQFFTDAAAQDQTRVAAGRDYEMFMNQIEMAADLQ